MPPGGWTVWHCVCGAWQLEVSHDVAAEMSDAVAVAAVEDAMTEHAEACPELGPIVASWGF